MQMIFVFIDITPTELDIYYRIVVIAYAFTFMCMNILWSVNLFGLENSRAMDQYVIPKNFDW